MFSALKHQGQPLYKLARAGQVVARKARTVTIHSLELLNWAPPLMEFRLRCSKGTYVRTLAEDIAGKLGSCAHLKSLRRLDVEPFQEKDMISLDGLESRAESGDLDDCLLPVDAGLCAWPVVELDASAAQRFSHGNPVEAPAGLSGWVRVYAADGKLLGLGQAELNKLLKPKRIMNFSG
jgi:tRNA pseudouridine55 synthase